MRWNGMLRLMTLAVLLSLGACEPSPSPEQEPAPVRAATPSTPYTLKIVFRGLIGFAEDSGNIWAFLVNAEYDPKIAAPDDLPPGMYQEGRDINEDQADWLDAMTAKVPPHFAYISFGNAKISRCSICDMKHNGRRPISGADLHLKADRHGEGKINLNALASACSVIKSRKELGLQLDSLSLLDQLDDALLASKRKGSRTIDNRLAALVEIELGENDEVSANLVPDNGEKNLSNKGKEAIYTFNLPKETIGCSGELANGQKIAEEVVVTRKGVIGPVILNFSPNDEITIEPKIPGGEVVVNILNQPYYLLDHPGQHYPHEHAYRWFYRLLDREGQSRIDEHFRACRRHDFGPPDCPQKQFFIGRKRCVME